MSKVEIERILENLPDHEKRFLEDGPSYNRNGLIPSWAEVVMEFKLEGLHPRDFRLVRGFYRAQRKIAEGASRRARRIFNALDNNPDFKNLEEKEGPLLTHIASFIRKSSEKKRP